jgi:3-deoxy-manno-octulosonate cytidylyltransferase (CMP-KDO synthetase)
MKKILAVIPARYSSTRFPGKPLAQIKGRPMIEWVYRAVMESKKVNRVIVATDEIRIADKVKEFGGDALITPSQIPSGTDRVAYVARGLDFDIIINVQGDEPLLKGYMIDLLAEEMLNNPSIEMATLVRHPLEGEIFSLNSVKVVADSNLFALYFSRAPIPCIFWGDRNPEYYWCHIGVYGFRRDTLMKFVSLPKSRLEKLENLEQLRALENGIPIKLIPVGDMTHPVDTPEDIEIVEKLMEKWMK